MHLWTFSLQPAERSVWKKDYPNVNINGFHDFNLGCALAPNWPLLLLFRLLVRISATGPITVIAACMQMFYWALCNVGKH